LSNQIIDTLLTHWRFGRKIKKSSSGWLSGNAPCCVYRGENIDKRARGGILIPPDNQSFRYHCFNCNFTTGWEVGQLIGKNTKLLFTWMGIPDNIISELKLYALKLKDGAAKEKTLPTIIIQERKLPDDTKSIVDWINENCQDENLIKCIDYILFRGLEFNWYPWHWSKSPGFQDRLLIPFYQNSKIVGYTARKIVDGKPKYLTESQQGYVFNIDNQHDKKFVILVEGQLDAIAIDGVAAMQNELTDLQCLTLNNLNKEVIVVPDRDKAGSKLINYALKNNWSVSSPPWEKHIKDVADAVKKYGRLYTLYTILFYKQTNKIKIELIKKKLESYD
jgi:5S rRNA maturation endonuclease (ribonuclease M5)